jgi:tetratricopeptide (TPR) repeat protein
MDINIKKVFSHSFPLPCGSPMWKQWIPDKSSRRRESSTMDLRAELNKALEQGRMNEALKLYELVEARKPDEPRWSQRKGDLLHRIGRKAEALRAYERAVDLYSAKGFNELATAIARLMLRIDPSRSDVLERVNRVADRGLEQRHFIETQLGLRNLD